MPTYLSKVGPKSGPVRDRDNQGAIGVLGSPGNNMPIGMALGAGRTEDGLAIWRLTVRGAEIPGRWIIADREFRLGEGKRGDLYNRCAPGNLAKSGKRDKRTLTVVRGSRRTTVLVRPDPRHGTSRRATAAGTQGRLRPPEARFGIPKYTTK